MANMQVRAGDLVEATIASSHPRPIRIRVDREPWPVSRRATALSDGRRVIAVLTNSIRVIEDRAPDRVERRQAELRAAARERIAAVAASTCETCREGCRCDPAPDRPNGCAHLGCWGPDATEDCPEAARLRAAYPLR
jgi:hypothetical protein